LRALALMTMLPSVTCPSPPTPPRRRALQKVWSFRETVPWQKNLDTN
jgi:hypothetical protein